MKHILKCKACGRYSLKEACVCGGKAKSPCPPKYSPEDNYGKYRRQAKKEIYSEKGFI